MKAVKVNRYLMPILVVVALLGSAWIAKAAGVWQTSGRDQILLDGSGQPDPLGIKGWMTLSDLSETYGVPLDALYVMIGAGSDVPPGTVLKDLEKLVPGMEVSAVRAGVAAYQAGFWKPADGRFGAAALDQALEAPPAPEPAPTPEPEASPEAVLDHVPQASGDGSGEGFVLPEDGSRLPGSEIRGRMTLQEVVDHCQVPLDYLILELGLPEDVDTGLLMRDLANQMGVEVVTVREVVERFQAGQ
jgi:hypothetical protein